MDRSSELTKTPNSVKIDMGNPWDSCEGHVKYGPSGGFGGLEPGSLVLGVRMYVNRRAGWPIKTRDAAIKANDWPIDFWEADWVTRTASANG